MVPRVSLASRFLFPKNGASYEAILRFHSIFPKYNIDFREVAPSLKGSSTHLQIPHRRASPVVEWSESTTVLTRTEVFLVFFSYQESWFLFHEFIKRDSQCEHVPLLVVDINYLINTSDTSLGLISVFIFLFTPALQSAGIEPGTLQSVCQRSHH